MFSNLQAGGGGRATGSGGGGDALGQPATAGGATAAGTATVITPSSSTASSSSNDLKHPNTDDHSIIRRPSQKKKKISNSHHQKQDSVGSAPPTSMTNSSAKPRLNRPITGGMLSLAGIMPTTSSSSSSSTTPFNQPAAFQWAQAAGIPPSVGDGALSSLATSRIVNTQEAPDYFAQQAVPSPATSSAFDMPSQQPQPPSTDINKSDPFGHMLPQTSASYMQSPIPMTNNFQIPSGALSSSSTGAGSRFSLPSSLGKLPISNAGFGGISMSARSSRQSTASSAHSIADSTNSAGPLANAGSPGAGLPQEFERFKPVEPDALAFLLSGSSSEELSETSPSPHSSMDATSISSTSASSSSSSLSAAEKVLIIDIRSSASYSSARIRSSINVCAPSTLLKRPGITVDQVEEEMLGSEGDRRRFKRWREGPRRVRAKASGHPEVGQTGMSLSRSNSRSKKSSHHSHPSHGSPSSTIASPNRPLTLATHNAPALNSSPSASQHAGAEETTLLPASTHGITKIIVLDTDTARVASAGKPATGGGGSCLVGMLRKFEAAGFAGELGWLVGGFNRFVGCKGAKEAGLIDRAPLVDREEGEDAGSEEKASSLGTTAANQRLAPFGTDMASRRSSAPNAGKLFLGGMSSSTHSLGNGSDTTANAQGDSNHRRHFLVQPRGLPLSAFNASTTTSTAANFGDKGGMSGSQTRNTNSVCANPFFDNIRQNRELAHGVTERVPMPLPSMSSTQVSALPVFLQKLTAKTEKDRAEQLAQGFFSIEQAEQKRLMGTMQQHSAESDADPRHAVSVIGPDGKPVGGNGPNSPSPSGNMRQPTQLSSSLARIDAVDRNGPAWMADALSSGDRKSETAKFPFSIAAALERGADNRYDNIWTYEHSRVQLARLRSLTDPNSNYINASFIQPAREFGCTRTYIASQAPLPTTFEHFWMMCWEQNVRVIVMVTREHEAGRIQAHRYWDATSYGRDVRLRQVGEQCFDSTGVEVHDAEAANRLASNANDEAGDGLFPTMPNPSATGKDGGPGRPVLIRRTFVLSNAAEPEEGERTLTQLQYVAWPDYTVPESPESLLRLLDEADAAQFQAEQELSAPQRAQPNNFFSHGLNGQVSKAEMKRAVGPMVVHCSAGVGRTGTFVAVDSALDAIRRQRAKAKGESLGGVWHNGKASSVNINQAQQRGGDQVTTSFAPEHRMSTGTPPATSDSKVSQVSPTSQAHQPPVTPPRPALKREHSMDLDEAPPSELKAQTVPFQFSFDPLGHRPRARTRSIEPGGSDGENDFAHGGVPSLTSGTSSPEPQSGWSAPSPLPTPLRHLDSMCLTSASPRETPLPPQDENSPMMDSTPQAMTPSIPSLSSSSSASALKAADEKDKQVEQADIIQKIVEVMREQRMSSVQTTRQFVFVYSAVLAGVLRELRADGIN
ncbi:hypothetical protein A4X13_0g1987 [Tilletia indica]|uniref:protein-tyrosine-phosphatase n=1 Tax=Tilletia indica TaxID=43049 RepID=A0A177TN05_9BASI|nr:hypothetical protein A4X13_0g1987 [Tilletia indica]